MYDSLECYLLALESIGVTSDKYAMILFPLESCIPEDVLRACSWNTGALLRDNNGSSTFGDRIKDLSFLHSEFGGEESSSLIKSGCRLSGVHRRRTGINKWRKWQPRRLIYHLVRRRKKCVACFVKDLTMVKASEA